MDGRYPFYYPPGSFPMNYPDFGYFNPKQAPLNFDQVGPSGILASADQSISPVSTASDSPSVSRLSSRSSEVCEVEATGQNSAQKEKKQYDKWSNEEQKALISLWADRHE